MQYDARMDDIVKQAMAKWPNVPACWGWLALDARGNWWLRDAQAQAAGAFTSGLPGAKGSRVEHDKLAQFIARNYLADVQGCWYFQNGPQQVFVELEATPWVWRAQWRDETLHLHAHTGAVIAPAQVQAVLADEQGAVYLHTGQGLGIVHTQDVLDVSQALEQGLLPEPTEVASVLLEKRYGFVRSPAALKAAGQA